MSHALIGCSQSKFHDSGDLRAARSLHSICCIQRSQQQPSSRTVLHLQQELCVHARDMYSQSGMSQACTMHCIQDNLTFSTASRVLQGKTCVTCCLMSPYCPCPRPLLGSYFWSWLEVCLQQAACPTASMACLGPTGFVATGKPALIVRQPQTNKKHFRMLGRCAVSKQKCTAALVWAECISHYSVLLCRTGSQQACVNCNYTFGDLLFTQVCSDPTEMHCSSGLGKLHFPLFSSALQKGSQQACVTPITPMEMR